MIVKSKVPYDITLYGWLQVHDIPLDTLTHRSRRYERAYLAWEMVRKLRNPFFTNGTGFEGYFVGIHQSPEEMLNTLLKLGHNILESNCRLYRHDHVFQSMLMKTLIGECCDLHAIDVWADLLGALLGRLRCNIPANDENHYFQNETYWIVNNLPGIRYTLRDFRVEQEYRITLTSPNTASRMDFNLNMLRRSDYEAGLVIHTLGRFGHPLVREYLHQAERAYWHLN